MEMTCFQSWWFLLKNGTPVFVFQKICFKVKVQKTFQTFTDCHIRACWSLKQGSILRVSGTPFWRGLCPFCWLQNFRHDMIWHDFSLWLPFAAACAVLKELIDCVNMKNVRNRVICKPRDRNLGIGIGTDITNAIISSFTRPMYPKFRRVVT